MIFARSAAAILLIALVEHLCSIYLPVLLYVDLFLLYAIYSGLLTSQLVAAYSGFVAGAVQDALSGLSIGINGFSKTGLGFAAATINRYIVLDSRWLRLLTVFSASLLNSAIISMLLYSLGQLMPAHFVRTAAIQAVSTSVAGVLLFHFLDRFRSGGDRQLARPYAD